MTVVTDHKALEGWATETLDTPSGPVGRRSRWHEFLSKFDLTVEYLPGKVNDAADSLSRWAYPASQAAREVSKHGTWENKKEREELDKKEREEERECMVITRSGKECEPEASSTATPNLQHPMANWSREQRERVSGQSSTDVASSSNQPFIPQEVPAGGPEGLPTLAPNNHASEPGMEQTSH